MVVGHKLNLVHQAHGQIDEFLIGVTLNECVHLDFEDDFLDEAVKEDLFLVSLSTLHYNLAFAQNTYANTKMNVWANMWSVMMIHMMIDMMWFAVIQTKYLITEFS